MEKNFVKNAILNFFSTHTDFFGEHSVYEDFKKIHTHETTLNGFNSIFQFGQIVYRDVDGTSHESEPLFIKLLPESRNSEFALNSFINEIKFYTKVVPAFCTLDESFSSLFAKFYHGEVISNSKTDQSLIILEDLKYKGYRMTNKKSFQDRHHLILMMRKLGQFHAYSYKAKNDIPRLFYAIANHRLESNQGVNEELCGILPVVGQPGLKYLLENYPAYKKYAPGVEKLLQNSDELYVRALSNDKENPTSVICHGDFLRNNVMFKYENGIPEEMVFVDVASFRLSSPVIDLITVLYINTDQQTRDELWDTLIDEYYTALKTTFPDNTVPTKSEILSEFPDKAFYGYQVATYFLPGLIANDNKIALSKSDQMASPKHQKVGLHQLPTNVLCGILLGTGSEASNRALGDILRDMIDRGFICKST